MPTLIGIIFFMLSIYCFLFKEDGLLGLLIIASVFEAASAIDFGERGVQPYYIVALFIVVRGMLNKALGYGKHFSMAQGRWLLLFGSIGIASAFVLPIAFSGLPIYDPKIGIDPGLFTRPPLRFGLNNLGQAGFLALHIATAFALLRLPFSRKGMRRSYLVAFYIVLTIVFARMIWQRAGMEFPDSLIRNNPGYALSNTGMLDANGVRNPGTFTEPSYAGAFFVMYCVGFMAEYLQGIGNVVKVLLALVASGVVASSSSLLVIAVFVLMLAIGYSPIQLPWTINTRRLKRHALLLFLVVIPMTATLLFSSNYRETITTITVSKGDSSSFFARTAADMYALQLLPASHWLGVGLGSNRASSMLTTLLSNIGIVGVIAFGAFYIKLFADLRQEDVWLRWGGFAILFNMCAGIADVTSPILWIPIMMAIELQPRGLSAGGNGHKATLVDAAT